MSQTEKHFSLLRKRVDQEYIIAAQARKMGLDPSKDVEVPLATSLAEKTVGLISTVYPQLRDTKISKRILELEQEYGQLNFRVCLKIAEEVAKEKYCKFESLIQAIDAGARLGFAYETLGVVASPIEGYTGLKLGKTKDGKEYFKVNFSGPIRSAGTTATCRFLILVDYLRELFGYAKYDPDENEIKRYVTENFDYHERVTNLQYLPTEEEIIFLAKRLPIQIDGDPTEKKEVSNFKDLPRVETNFIRGGMCLCFSEGLAQKAQKAVRSLKEAKASGFQSTGWDYLDEYIILHKKREKGSKDTTATYIKDLVAGRPVYGHPSRSGSFRFRYGRSRGAGFSATSIHPCTMFLSNNFLSNGTQLKIEKPTKGCIITCCDSIDGPIVKFKNGSVKKISDVEESKKIFDDIAEIIYLGDMLFPLGDVLNRNAELLKPGYVEEWWALELKKELNSRKETLDIDCFNVPFEKALELSKNYGVPLHPSYIFYWTQIKKESFRELLNWLSSATWNEKLILPYSKNQVEEFFVAKRALELIGAEHEVFLDNVVVKDGQALLSNFGLNETSDLKSEFLRLISNYNDEEILEFLNRNSPFKIKDKAGDFIGARMGRPEKAKLRRLTGSPNVLFSIGEQGGRFRSLNEAVNIGFAKADFPLYFCEKCEKESIYRKCTICGGETKKRFYCRECGKILDKKCREHLNCSESTNRKVELKDLFNQAVSSLGYEDFEVPSLIKGIRGTSSDSHEVEQIVKGILRAKYNLCVNKDGTIRYDATEVPLTHFKPKEIGTPIEKLRELGYTKDCYGNDLVDENQILNLMPHDILLPSCPFSHDEKADDVFLNISKFIDELLEKFYHLPRYFNIDSREGLIGQLVVCMAPHNCAGVIGRIIGFTKIQGLVASPFMHAAMRRDCMEYSTNFVYGKNNLISCSPIGEFVENLISSGANRKKIDSFGTEKISLDQETFVFGIDPLTRKQVRKKVTCFIRGKNPEGWVKIKTSSGREQTMTSNHKFMYLDKDNKLKIKKANEINVGDRILILNNFNPGKRIRNLFLPEFLCNNLPLKDLDNIQIVGGERFFDKLSLKKNVREIVSKNFWNISTWKRSAPLSLIRLIVDNKLISWKDLPSNIYLKGAMDNNKWKLNLPLDENLATVLGYYSAKGYNRQTKTIYQLGFRINDSHQIRVLTSALEKSLGMSDSSSGKENVNISNQFVYYLFKAFDCGKKDSDRQVPNIMFNLSKASVKSYLSAYFDCCGSLSFEDNVLCFHSSSRSILDGISLLCSMFRSFGKFSKSKGALQGKNLLSYYGSDLHSLIKILNPADSKKKKLISSFIKSSTMQMKSLSSKEGLSKLQHIGDTIIDNISEVKRYKKDDYFYCFDVDARNDLEKNVLWGEQIINLRCDGDEAAIMLLMDILLNFSFKYLPSHRGGTQDAPLVLNTRIREGEVDDQILDFETCWDYPLRLYELAEQRKHSSEIKIETVKSFLKQDRNSFEEMGFTHNTENIHVGVYNSAYKVLPSMREKVLGQMELANKLRSVDESDVARLVIERHFIRDIRGNLRKFSHQVFRCVKCNEKYRRPPLSGVCRCGGKIIFTISEGSIKKYLDPALELAENYNIPPYTKQSLDLAKLYIESIFGKETERQVDLSNWFK